MVPFQNTLVDECGASCSAFAWVVVIGLLTPMLRAEQTDWRIRKRRDRVYEMLFVVGHGDRAMVIDADDERVRVESAMMRVGADAVPPYRTKCNDSNSDSDAASDDPSVHRRRR